MRILCLAKRVPDSRAPIKPSADGAGIDGAGLKFVLDPFDEFGVEQAVQLKERRTDVAEITVLGVGPADTAEVLRHALAMGADRAVHITGDASIGRDELALAALVAAAVRRDASGFGLIFCGKQNIDNDAGELGPALAELLDLPHVGAATKLEVSADGQTLTARRRIEGAEEVVACSTPALVTCEKGLVDPRTPPLPKLMKAKKQPVETIAAEELLRDANAWPGATFVRLGPPPARPPCTFIDGDPATMAKELVRRLREEAKVV